LKRLVPSLLLDDTGAWVTRQFNKRVYLGEPSNVVRMFNEMMADELSITWVGGDQDLRNKTLATISSQASMPLTFSGNIASPFDALQIMKMGFERVCITSAYLQNPTIASEISGHIGRSSVVLKIPVRSDGRGWQVWSWQRSRPSGLTLETLLRGFSSEHVGEIVLVSVDKNGMRSGIDKSLSRVLGQLKGVQKGYEGGVSSEQDVADLWGAGVDAVYSTSYLMLFGQFEAPLIDYPTFGHERYLE